MILLVEKTTSEVEMPGLKAFQDEFGTSQPFKGARIATFVHKPTKTSVLVKTLKALGAQEVRCFSTHDHAAVFASKEEYWRGIERALYWAQGGGPNLIFDDGRDAAFLIHEGLKVEEIYAKTERLPESSSVDDAELQIVVTIIWDGLKTDPKKYHKMKERVSGGVFEEMTDTTVNRFYHAINVNDSVKYGNFFNFSLSDMRGATNITMISGKRAVVHGFGDDGGKWCAKALKQAGADVAVYEVDPNREVQARLGDFSVIKTLDDDVVYETDVFVINKVDIVNVVNHVKKMKNDAIIYIIDPVVSDHNGGDMYAGALLEQCFSGGGMKPTIIGVNPQTDKWVFPETESNIIVYKGYTSFMSSWYYTSLVVALLDLWTTTGKYDEKKKKKVYGLPEHLEKKVCALHLAKFKGGVEEEEDDELMEEQGNNVFFIKSDPKGILRRAVTACSVFGIVAFGLSTASKVKMELSVSAVWG